MEKYVWVFIGGLYLFLFVFLLWNNGSKDSTLPDNISTLTRQASRWLTASEQDENPLIALLHGQYGMGYLWAISDIATPAQFNKATQLDWKEFKTRAIKVQKKLNERIVQVCPRFAHGLNEYFAKIGGEI